MVFSLIRDKVDGVTAVNENDLEDFGVVSGPRMCELLYFKGVETASILVFDSAEDLSLVRSDII